jgi:hypothetical protein
MTIIEPQANPFSIDSYFSAAAKSLTAAEKKTIAAIDSQIGAINSIDAKFQPQRISQGHALDAAIDAAIEELGNEPTDARAIALHDLLCRRANVQISHQAISGTLAGKVRRLTDALTPIAVRLIDEAEKTFNEAADKHRAANADGAFSSDLAQFNARAAATQAAFAEKRRWVKEENAAGHFLLAELGIN